MLTVIIPTKNHEHALAPTLAMLVPGAMTGTVSQVIVADGDSTDATAEVVDVAGCEIMTSTAPLAARLRSAAAAARGSWLMVLRPGRGRGPARGDAGARRGARRGRGGGGAARHGDRGRAPDGRLACGGVSQVVGARYGRAAVAPGARAVLGRIARTPSRELGSASWRGRV